MQRRIDRVKNRKMKNVKHAMILDSKRILIVFKNGHEIILQAYAEDYGYDAGIYIEKDNVETIYD